MNEIEYDARLSKCIEQIMSYVVRRNHSSDELRIKLRRKGFPSDIIEAAVERCREMYVIDDQRFAEQYINELAGKGQGRNKIIYSLQKKGIDRETAEKQLDSVYQEEDETEKAEKVLIAKLKILSTDKNLTDYKKKEKIFRHLVSKGFSMDVVYDLLGKYFK